MKNNTLYIGLTGPTGSGKSAVAAFWAQHGAVIVDADRASRAVTQPGHPCLAELAEAFSAEILYADGSLNRKALAHIAFADKTKTDRLVAITHPHILRLCREQAEAAADGGAPAVVFDAPLLFESGLNADCDLTVAVLASPQTRAARICARDGLTEEEARLRMAAQPKDDFYRQRADRLLQNDGDKETLFRSANAIWPGEKE